MAMGGRKAGRALTALLAVCTAALFASGTVQAAEPLYVFDPVLSLTGQCEEPTTLDSVPDPGCPPEEGAHPPNGYFKTPRSAATDAYGNILVPNANTGGGIDVFDPHGFFLTELSSGLLATSSLGDIAIDGDGHMYVSGFDQTEKEPVVLRLDPGAGYDPEIGVMTYEAPVKVLSGYGSLATANNSIAIDSEGHLYVDQLTHINKYKSASEGNGLLDSTIGQGVLQGSKWVTVDSRNGDVYATFQAEGEPPLVKVFSGAPGHVLKRTISGFSTGYIAPAIDETTGRLFVADMQSRKKIYVLPESPGDQTASEAIDVIEYKFQISFPVRIGVDNGAFSPNMGYVFAPSQGLSEKPPDHIYAFQPIPPPVPPIVKSVDPTEVTETEAGLEATINPGNAETDYRLEYVDREIFEVSGFAEATIAGEGTIPAGTEDVTVSASLSNLVPGAAYHIRAYAENHCKPEKPNEICPAEKTGIFATYATVPPFEACPNEALRAGSSAHLPDCRAYELVTPPDTGGRPPWSIGVSSGSLFGTPTAAVEGDSVSFIVGSGGIPGLGGAGGFFGDGYLSERSPAGWQTHLAGPSGDQMSNPEAGGLSPDHGFSAWTMNGLGSGSLFLEGGARYMRYPDGSFHLVGRGSLGDDPGAVVKRITEAGGHIIFVGEVQIESEAPSTGTAAIYDRTIDPLTGEEETHVVSLLPKDETPGAGQDATLEGSSSDGSAVAFKLGNLATSPLYVRVDNAETLVAAGEPGSQFAGLSEEGRYLFYVLAGDLFRFDSAEETTDRITESGDAVVVNVASEGARAYFVSASVLTGEEENSEGGKAALGEENLYVWDGSSTHFIGTLTERDVEGEYNGNTYVDGLGLWAFNPESLSRKPITTGELSKDPSQSTPDGTQFVFKSRAALTDYESDGEAEVYRYDAQTEELECLSCNPTGAPAAGDASLLSVGSTFLDAPVKTFALVPSLRSDGSRAFFESPERLVIGDTNGLQDVYEWEEEGIGSCTTPGGCVYLISSGHSSRPSYLFGVSASGDDVFISTSDQLVGADQDETPSIYDARVGGGFVQEEPEVCVGEACKPDLTPPLASPSPAQPSSGGSDNVSGSKRKHCPKGKRKVKRDGKVRCIKPRHKNHHKKHHRKGVQ